MSKLPFADANICGQEHKKQISTISSGVIGNSADFESAVLGSSPGWITSI